MTNKEIIIFSKLYGEKVILVDEKYYSFLTRFTWHVIDSGSNFYAVTNYGSIEKRISIRMHSLLFPNSEVVDHINGNGLDNREENLRPTTQANNTKNRFKRTGLFTSKYKGVTKDDHGSWRATITNDGKTLFIGAFTTELAAASAYNYFARQLHGEYAKINKLEEISNFEEFRRLKKTSKYKYISFDLSRDKWVLQYRGFRKRFETEELVYNKFLEIKE